MTYAEAVDLGQVIWCFAFFGGISFVLFAVLAGCGIALFKWIIE